MLVKNDIQTNLSIHVANDGALYKDLVAERLKEKNNQGQTQSVLILIPLRLGIDNLNPIYISAIKNFFEIPNCCGIAGFPLINLNFSGRPNSSLYFIGIEGDNLIYLDPHTNRPTVPLMDIQSYKKQVY